MNSTSSFDHYLSRALDGDDVARQWVLEQYESYLKLRIRRAISGTPLERRASVSDIYQDAIADALAGLRALRAKNEIQFRGWLIAITDNRIRACHRHWQTGARDATLERPFRLTWHDFDDNQESPSRRVVRDEDAIELARCLQQLPSHHRTAIELRYLDGLALSDIAVRMDCSRGAVVGYLTRGTKSLREMLAKTEVD